MVTQVQSVPCFICVDCYDDDDEERPKSSSEDSKIKSVILNNVDGTLPLEKQKSSLQQIESRRRDSSFRKTYNEDDKKQASPCGNCALTVPSHLKEKIPVGAPGSPGQNEGSPYLRTRRPVQRVSTPSSSSSSSSPSSSSTSDTSDSDTQSIAHPHNNTEKNTTSNAHNHYLDYTSTHTPLTSPTYTLLRNCCLRTLSTETLPPTTTNSYHHPPTSPLTPSSITPSFNTTSSGGGPIFFGDPLAGYTTAYIFRIPDPFARGRIRRYALMALDTRGQRRAMRAFSFLAGQFRELASWILGLAEREAERLESGDESAGSALSGDSSPKSKITTGDSLIPPTTTATLKSKPLVSYPTLLTNLETSFPSSAQTSIPTTTTDESERERETTITSSFLKGRQSAQAVLTSEFGAAAGLGNGAGGYQKNNRTAYGGYNVVRARGLAELVGMEDFFLELHRRFVVVLATL